MPDMKLPENEYLVIFGFTDEKQLLEFTEKSSGKYDIMRLIKANEYYMDLIINFNCKYWAVAKLFGFNINKIALESVKDEEDL